MSSINTPEEVKAAEQERGAVFLDVRKDEEVKAESLQSRRYVHLACSLDDCSELMNKAETLISDKNGELRLQIIATCLLALFATSSFLMYLVVTNPHNLIVPVIVFCRSGRRAAKAKEVLEKMGYTKVLNAGGLKDLGYLM